ncbi:protein S100-A11 [Rhynchocyon petersi]
MPIRLARLSSARLLLSPLSTFFPPAKRTLCTGSIQPLTILPSSEPSIFSSKAKVASPTETERCIESLIAVFQKYAGRDGHNRTLSKTEFLTFMNVELGAFTKNQKDPGVLDRMMKKLDLNSDGQLDFQEFLNLIGGLAQACHESFTQRFH